MLSVVVIRRDAIRRVLDIGLGENTTVELVKNGLGCVTEIDAKVIDQIYVARFVDAAPPELLQMPPKTEAPMQEEPMTE
jgi:hypothetical protein